MEDPCRAVPRFSSNFVMGVELLVLLKLTYTMPRKEVQEIQSEQDHLDADPNYNRPGPIDIIIGVEEVGKILLPGIRKTQSGLVGQQTELGWIWSGNAKYKSQGQIQVVSMMNRVEEDLQLTKFWQLEEVSNKKVLFREDAECEQQYEQTITRRADGTYEVQIPFKEPTTKLGESRGRAVARLLQLERKFQRDENIAKRYKEFMEEYLVTHEASTPDRTV